MSCYHPLKAFVTDIIPDSTGKDKKRLKIVSYDTAFLVYDHGDWFPVSEKDKEAGNDGRFYKKVAYRYYDIPCGQCIGCRLDYSRQWANRLMMELQDHDPGNCWFFTLTYDNDHVPVGHYLDESTGEYCDSLTLCKEDVQLFHKRLRKFIEPAKMRFFLAGEYGENTLRPHYHGIYFNCPLPFEEFELWKRTDQGFSLWHWPKLDEIWSKGRVIIAPVSWDTCAYTARYVTKKLSGKQAQFYTDFGLCPEFSLMSRKPGIARKYFETHDIDLRDKIYLSTDKGGIKFSPPRYFKDLIKVDNELECDIISSEKQRRALDRRRSIELSNDLAASDWQEYLNSCEISHMRGVKSLLRSDC